MGVDELDLLLVLVEGKAGEFLFSLDEVYSHVTFKYFSKGIIEDGEILHHEGLREELLRQLRFGELHEHLELLFLREELDLDFGRRRLLALRVRG